MAQAVVLGQAQTLRAVLHLAQAVVLGQAQTLQAVLQDQTVMITSHTLLIRL
jgi:hypothetical protein